MVTIAPGWELDVERGPDWLFVKLHCAQENVWDSPPLASNIWRLLEQHFTYRLVLECDELAVLHSTIIAELVMLQKRVMAHGGVMRLCGLSEDNRDVLARCRLTTRFPNNFDRAEAVLGSKPAKPR
ncbi:MAG TPA: STAS domain-containing protein [Pirellulales bacterium]|jgi:anti-anti-sigma regulatory factor|nr:STAS domain-containing protein [Pirellulales bacterium]